MKLLKNMENVVGIVIEILYYHLNMNLLASHVDITYTNESMNSLKYNERKLNFINRLKYAEAKIFSICVDVYKIYEGDDYDEIFKVLTTLKNKKLKINNTLIEIYKDMIKNPVFEQNYWSRTAKGIYKIGHDSVRLKKFICYYDRSYYANINYYDLMGGICNHLNEISKR